jgi:hypothetical protein
MQAWVTRLWQKAWLLCAVLALASVAVAVAAPPANDNFADARVISGDTGQFNGTNQEATAESGEPPHFVSGAAASVWYRWTAPRNGEMVFNLTNILPAENAPTLVVYTGSSVDNLTLLSHVTGSQLLRLNAVGGATYSLVVATYYQAPVNFTLNWQAVPPPPPPPPPPNDNFAQAQVIHGIENGIAGTSIGSTAEAGEPGGEAQSVWYRWQVPGDGRFRFVAKEIINGTYQEFAECRVYRGTTLNSLSLIASGGSGFDATADEFLYIAINGNRSFILNWNLVDPYANDTQNTAQLISGASGKVAGSIKPRDRFDTSYFVWYRWTAPFSGQVRFHAFALETVSLEIIFPITGHRTNQGTVFPVTAGQTYVFTVGTADTYYSLYTNFVLSWSQVFPQPPANDNFADAQPLSGTAGYVGSTTVYATREAGEPQHNGSSPGASVWYRWQAPVSGLYDWHGRIFFYTGDSLETLTRVNTVQGLYESSTRINATAGTVYYIAVENPSYSGNSVGYETALHWDLRPHNDNSENAETIYGSSGEVAGTCVGATLRDMRWEKESHIGTGYPAVVWYKWIAPTSTKMEFRFDTSVPATSNFILAVGYPRSLDQPFARATRSGTQATSAYFYAVEGGIYYFAVGGGRENFRFFWRPAPPPVLSITISPTTFSETNSEAPFGTITRTGDTLDDLNITLTNSDPASVLTPPTMMITRGASSASFPISGINNFIDDGTRDVTITASATTPAGVQPVSITVSVTDDDTAGINVSPTRLTTTESSGQSTFGVVLKSKPTANVTVDLASTKTAEGTVSPAQLIFTPQNWNVTQQATVTGVDDGPQADGNQTYYIVTTVRSSDLLYDEITALDVEVVNADNDRAGITVNPTSGLTTTEAGGVANFYMVLNSRPTSTVTIPLSITNPAEGELSTPTVIFTPDNWNVTQAVTVKGVADNSVDGNIKYWVVTAPAQSLDPKYQDLDPLDVELTNQDVDSAAILVSPLVLSTTEGGGTAKFKVRLNSRPTSNVTFSLASNNSDEGTISASSLTFTPANWSVEQEVVVTGVDDNVDDGDVTYWVVTTLAQSLDPKYHDLDPLDVEVVNADNDRAGIIVNPTSGLTTTEAGGAASFTMALSSRPSGNVSIALSSTNTAEGQVPGSVTFTPDNWNISQAVTVTGVDDDIADGDIKYWVVTAPARSLDPQYHNLDPLDVELSNTDDDAPALSFSLSVSEVMEGNTNQGTLTRNSNLDSVLEVALLSNNSAASVPAKVTLPAGTRTATFPINTLDDEVAQGTRIVTITATAGRLAARRELKITDDEVPDLSLSLSATSVEEGGSLTGTLRRNTLNEENQTVNLTASGLSVPATVVFPAGQLTATFAVVAPDDGIATGNRMASVTATSGAFRLRSEVNVLDRQTPQLTLSLAVSTVAENAGAPVMATLTRNTPTTAALRVLLSSNDHSEAQVPEAVTIPAGSTSVTFPVTPQDDNLADGLQSVGLLASAPGFAAPASAQLTVTDNEVPQLSLTLNSNRMAENGMATATLSRNSEVTSVTPALGVSVTANVAGQLTVPTRVVIPLGATSVSFPVRAVDDNVADGPREVTLFARATGFMTASANLIVLDNEAASNGVLSGKVLLSALQGSAPVPGVELTLRRGTAVLDRTLTSPDGSYVFRALPAGSYSVTPTKAGYAFAPLARAASLTTAVKSVSNLNFVGVPRAQISGVVTKRAASGGMQALAGVSVIARGTLGTFTTRTNSNGQFVFDRLTLGTYLVTPAIAGRVFSPKLRIVNLTAAAPVVSALSFVAANNDTVAPTVVVRTPGGNVTDSTKSTLTASGSAADNSGGSGVLSVTVALARFSGPTATVPNGFLNWSNQSFATTDRAATVEALAGGTTSWNLNGAALAALRGLPAGAYGVRATVSDGAGNVTRSAWKRFSITSTTRQYEEEPKDEEPVPTPVAGSPVRLSGAVATTQQVTLRFSGPLNDESASDVANYAVEIGGRVIEIESVAYANGVVRLGLAEVAVQAGTNLSVEWRNLRDAQGRLVPSAATAVIVR